MTVQTQTQTTLVLGGTGKTGRRIQQRLQDAGRPSRVGSRRAEQPFDWQDSSTWPGALDAVTAVYISYYPDLCVPGAFEQIESFVDLAIELGVRRFVLLSGRGEVEAQAVEEMLQSKAAEWSILRASWFMQNFSEHFLLDAIRSGEVALPVGAVREPFIDVEDIADVAFAALTEDGHAGRVYELTGPEALRFPDAIAAIANEAGRELQFEDIPLESYVEGLRQAGLAQDFVDLIAYLFGTVLDGRNESCANGVEEALGRRPGSFADYVRRTAKSSIWAE